MFKVLILQWFVIVLFVIDSRLTAGELRDQYIGCYSDNSIRVMGSAVLSNNMTLSKCLQKCNSTAYFGVQNGDICFCADKYDTLGPADNCTMPCSGNQSEICGGEWATSVYSINIARGQPTWQISTSNNAPSNLAVDGNRDSKFGGNSCTHTAENQVNPWWAVDLGRPTNVGKVVFYNRQDCCAERANDFIVGLADVSPTVLSPNVGSYRLCGRQVGAAGAVETVNCSVVSPAARYVIVQLNRIGTLTICELEVYQIRVNECAGDPCLNGGTCYNQIGNYSCKCVPGYDGSICEQDVNECASNPCRNAGTCNDEIGNYSCKCVHLYGGRNCEQEVNIARGQPTWQSSTSNNAPSDRAVDGNRDSKFEDNSCTHTAENQVNPWWAVDLGQPTDVEKVVFYNRRDCCADRANDFIVGLTNVSPTIQSPTVGLYSLCGRHAGAVGAVETVNCSALFPAARYVIVQLNRTGTLTICELEVYERDIDECAQNTNNCEHFCTNTRGSYYCSCRSGFTLNTDGHACNDIDECIGNKSGCTQLCNNFGGGYNCLCSSGYVLNANNRSCNDINECLVNNANCSHICANTPGSYRCSCEIGYALGAYGINCNDIDECASSDGNCSHVCQNTPGSFRCYCPDGFTLSADRRTCEHVSDCPVGATVAAIVLGVVAALLAVVLIVVLIACGKRNANLQRQLNEFTGHKGSDVIFSSSRRAETADPDRIYTEFQIAGDNSSNYQTLDAAPVTKDEQSYEQIKQR